MEPGTHSCLCKLVLMWCDLQGSNWLWCWGLISRVPKGSGSHVSGIASEWGFFNGLSSFMLLLKDQFKSNSTVLLLLATLDPNHRSCLCVSSAFEGHFPKWSRLCTCEQWTVCKYGCSSPGMLVLTCGYNSGKLCVRPVQHRQAVGKERSGKRETKFLPQKWEPADQWWDNHGVEHMLSWLLLDVVSEAVWSRHGVLRHCGIETDLLHGYGGFRSSLGHMLSEDVLVVASHG